MKSTLLGCIWMSSSSKKKAVELFEDAFDRLKRGKPTRLPSGASVTQNNVAKEAGRDPSALRAERYPELLQRIKAYIASAKETAGSGKRAARSRARKIEERLADCRRQRDRLLSVAHAQETLIGELMEKIQSHSDDEVVELRSGKNRRRSV